MSEGRPVELDEARATWVRVYPVKGTPLLGLIPTVNSDGDLQFSSGFELQGPALTDDDGVLLTDDDGNQLYADWPGFAEIWTLLAEVDRLSVQYPGALIAEAGELLFDDVTGDVLYDV